MFEHKRSQRDYPLSFKLAVVAQVEKGEMTYLQAQDHYGIQGSSTVLVWLRKHGRQNWQSGTRNPLARKNTMAEPPLPLTPEQRIKALERELVIERQKAAFFEAVVDVMEKEYGATLTKKPVGKSSRPKR